MAKDKTRVTARFPKTDAARLLTFNVTKKRIFDLCNRTFEDDFLDESKDYSSWHRGLDGKEVWEGIVLELDGLLTSQTERRGAICEGLMSALGRSIHRRM